MDQITAQQLDILWLMLSAFLILLMQSGFLCLEAGLTRPAHAINVAFKNLADFILGVMLFWAFGFALMFGETSQGWIGHNFFFVSTQQTPWLTSFFIFQSLFCVTAATIVSGAIAERVYTHMYLLIAALISGIIYPIFGHWAWAGNFNAHEAGWLQQLGFIDFAGSTVVHSLGGWVALAVLLLIGPRMGRFPKLQKPVEFTGANLPLALLGACLMLIGWFGFNGGSTFAFDHRVPSIIGNTLLAASSGALTSLVISWAWRGYADVTLLINGLLSGLVGITASCHAVSSGAAVSIGMVAAVLMWLSSQILIRYRIDDAVGAIPVHLVAGIWGTLAVAIFGDLTLLNTGLSHGEQFFVQLLGVVVCGVWAFGVAWLVLNGLNRISPLRITLHQEQQGLNVSEHGAHTELFDLLEAMRQQEEKGEMYQRLQENPFSEVGMIARQYNRVMNSLARAVNQTKAIVQNLRDGVVTFGRDGLLTSFNPGAEQLFGVSSMQALGQPVAKLLSEPDRELFATAIRTLRLPIGKKQELLGQRADSSHFFMELTVTQGMLGAELMFTAMIRDVSERKQVEEQLFAEKELAEVTLASIGDAVITTDHQGIITYLNPVAERLTGWHREQAQGQPLTTVYNVVQEGSREPIADPVQLVLNRGLVSGLAIHAVLVRHDGEEFAIEDTLAPIRNRHNQVIGVVLVFHDVTKSRKLAQRLSHQATHDALTGLVNRIEFENRLQLLLDNAESEHVRHVLCYMDLDKFKIVNDTCGHVAGDELLRQLTRLFKSRVRGSDTLARLGGDEFAILFHACPLDQAFQIANQLRIAVEDFRFVWQDNSFAVGVSIGLVDLTGNEGYSLSSVMAAADSACYAAKNAGRNRVHTFQTQDLTLAQQPEQIQWVKRIEDALEQDRLRLQYQPIVSLQDTQENGYYEIFVNMLDPSGRVLPPGAFMPAAERYNLMCLIDRWVVRNVLAWLSDTHTQHRVRLCALNLSAASLADDDFLQLVQTLFVEYKVAPSQICFEISETALMANFAHASHFIYELHKLGCLFALDDFGSGLSAFSYLDELHIDFIKIDGSYVRDIANNRMDYAMVESINHLSHLLRIKTIAEFVESQAALDQLRIIGVDFVQGFFIAEPRPLEQLAGVRLMPR